MKTGVIVGFEAQWGSGIAILVLRNRSGKIVRVPCENGSTARALDAIVGNFIEDGALNEQAILGKTVHYEVDDIGMLLNIDVEA